MSKLPSGTELIRVLTVGVNFPKETNEEGTRLPVGLPEAEKPHCQVLSACSGRGGHTNSINQHCVFRPSDFQDFQRFAV